jgi:hypothetical protein
MSPGSVNEKPKHTIFSYFHLHLIELVPATLSLSGQQLYHIESLHPVHAATATTFMDMIKGTFCTIVSHEAWLRPVVGVTATLLFCQSELLKLFCMGGKVG